MASLGGGAGGIARPARRRCSCSTTASTCSAGSATASSCCSPAAPVSPCWRPAGPGWCSRTSGSIRCRGLSLTDDGGDAVALFVARVGEARARPTPPDAGRAAALCRGLDGMALAIELAAARYSDAGAGRAGGRPRRAAAVPHRRPRAPTGTARSRHDRLELRPAPRRRSEPSCAVVAVFASWFDVAAARAVAGARERARSPTGWRASPTTACSSSTRRADQLPGAGDDPPVRHRAARRRRRAGRGPGPPRAVVPSRVRRRSGRPSRTRPGAPASIALSTTCAPPCCGAPGRSAPRARAAALAR